MEELPTAFGKYFLSERIATGGMAEIYLAKLIGPGGFEKQLVIKQISPALSADPAFVDLFVTEAKTLCSLSHGNLVPVFELGVVDDTYFIAMEYVDGPTVGELLAGLARAGERMAPAIAAYVVAELLDGLDYAHRKGDGLVHRDVSPRNVLCSRDGEVKLVDFGIAVAAGARQRGGLPVGSFPYMSPEQVRGEALDGRSDLFSAGVLLWELVTGAPLFARDTAEATLEAVLEAEIPPPSSRAPGVPAELDAICLRALARDPAARPATAGEMQAALNRFLYSLEAPVTAAAVAALVARVCPATRVGGDDGAADDEPRPVGDATRPMDRTKPLPRGKRMPTVKTFATSVAFASVLKNATPLVPLQAIREVPGTEAAEEAAPAAAAPTPVARRRVPMIAAGVAVVAVVAGVVFVQTRPEPATAAAPATAPAAAPAPTTVTDTVTPTVTPTVADTDTPTDTVEAADAGQRPSADGRRATNLGKRPSGSGSGSGSASGSGSGSVSATGRLSVGANPWADVVIDGATVGQAPGTFAVPAGRHTVELRFRDQRRRFDIAVTADQTTTIGLVDFTVPEP